MGVHDLWSILGPVCESVPLYSLTGKTLAVDLSLWVCEAQHVQGMMGKVTKPHLRNLFFRVSSLTLMGVKLVFVMEGEAPELKAETMSKRKEVRFRGMKKAAPKSTTSKNTSRGRFNAILKECADMLDYLGVPWVTAAGEAEAMCAYLDSQGLVDGCITNDGDAFLYGAQIVYRNFNMNTKDPQVDCYRTHCVQRELKLSRENLIGLAVLLGCDYIPKGVPGVGKEQALRLIQTLKGQTLLQKFHQWKEKNTDVPVGVTMKVPHCHVCRHPGSAKAHEHCGCVLCDSRHFCEPQDFDYQCPCEWHRYERTRQASSLETTIKRKTLASEQFPFTEIINEFLISKDKRESFRWRKPNMVLMQDFAYNKMEWPKHYTSEKVLVLMTYAEMMNHKYGRQTPSQINPLRIFKPRVRNAVACFEVIWSTPEHYVFPEDNAAENQDEVRTIEEEALFRLAYPELVELYLRDKALAEENKTKKKKAKSKKEKPSDLCDGVSDLLAQMTLQGAPSDNANAHRDTQALPSITPRSAAEPEIVDLVSPLPKRTPVTSSEDHCSLRDVPAAQAKGSVSPLNSASCRRLVESQSAPSPSVSAAIDALHLSDIDWDTSSFTSSLTPQGTSCRIPEPEQKSPTDVPVATSEPVSDLGYIKRSLWDRVLMRNTVRCLDQAVVVAHNDEVITKPHCQAPSLETTSSHPKPSGHILHIDCSDVKPLEKQHVAVDVGPRTGEGTIGAIDQAHHRSHSVPLSQAQSKANRSGNGKQKPKYKFVKAAISSPVLPARCHSDPCPNNKEKFPTTKRSVCASMCSSSDESDAENRPLRSQRKGQIKPQYKLTCNSHKDFRFKPTSTNATLNTATSKVLGPASVLSKHVDIQLEGSPSSTEYPLLASIDSDGCIVTPASPATVSDESVICGGSPLPLAERLRLKFLK